MSDSGHILPYASRTPRLPIHLAIILYLWGTFDLLGSVLLFLEGFWGITVLRDATGAWFLSAVLFSVLAPGFFIWSIITFQFASRIHSSEIDALRPAAALAIAAEVVLWCALLAFLTLALLSGEPLMYVLPAPTIVSLILLAATGTRILLRRAARNAKFANSLTH